MAQTPQALLANALLDFGARIIGPGQGNRKSIPLIRHYSDDFDALVKAVSGKIFLDFHVTDLDCRLNFCKVRDVTHNFGEMGPQRPLEGFN